ncbi:MAG: 4Fe-4S dicluster domain-containing protein [Candidatus Omnitrophota bacterium]
MPDLLYIPFNNLYTLLDSLSTAYEIFVPVKKGNQRYYVNYSGSKEEIVVGEVRAFEPLKSFFTRAREVVAQDFSECSPVSAKKPFCIVGAKACDLKGFLVHDHVFSNHDYPDPFYLRFREENLIISSDCTCTIETCFCCAVGILPYPQNNFDINLSRVGDGFIAESGSEKGKKIIEDNAPFFEDAHDRQISKRQALRIRVRDEVNANISANCIPAQESFSGIIERNWESALWQDEAKTCVECGACTAICPTCHCFLLYDQENQGQMARLRTWDSCMLKDYARVAGGANPRGKLWMRLRNRFEKKFDYFPKVANFYACTGCGRCITACPAKIDIRKVLKNLVG